MRNYVVASLLTFAICGVAYAQSGQVNPNQISEIIARIYANTDANGSDGPNVTLKQGSGITITRTNDTFEIAATGSGTIQRIYGGTDATGTVGPNVTLKAGSNVTVTRTNDTIEIAATDTTGITRIYGGTDSTGSTGPSLTIKAGSNVTVTRTGDTIEISSTATGGTSTGTYSAWVDLNLATYRTDNDTFTVLDDATTAAYLKKGLPIKFIHGTSTTYYAVISNVTDSGSTLSVDICGAPYTVGLAVGKMYAGTVEKVRQLNFAVNGYFADAADTALLQNDIFTFYKWDLPTSYLAKTSIRVATADSGASNPRVNVTLGTADVSTANSNAGVAVSTAWQDFGVTISTSNYDVNYGDTVEIKVDANGTNDDAKDLSVQMIFVLP